MGRAAETQKGNERLQCPVWGACLKEGSSQPRKSSGWDKATGKVPIVDGYFQKATKSSNHEITLTF